jgi:SAM-dependent methyltransferase
MARRVRVRELLIGIEGLALLRRLYDGDDGEADRRLAEVRRLLDDEDFSTAEAISEADPRTGYRSWSPRYDEPGNPIIAIEEPVVRSQLDRVAPGRALDAACGTGRHTEYLDGLGHVVIGVDLSPEMLARARRRVPGARFAEANLLRLPFDEDDDDQLFDVAVCGLALAHVADLRAGVAELARVLRPGGRLIVSVLHPFQALLGWQAPFEDEEGRRRFVREHPHTHADYLAAFAASGLELRDCIEPELSLAEVQAKRRAFRHIPEAAAAAYVGMPGVLVWVADKVR